MNWDVYLSIRREWGGEVIEVGNLWSIGLRRLVWKRSAKQIRWGFMLSNIRRIKFIMADLHHCWSRLFFEFWNFLFFIEIFYFLKFKPSCWSKQIYFILKYILYKEQSTLKIWSSQVHDQSHKVLRMDQEFFCCKLHKL